MSKQSIDDILEAVKSAGEERKFEKELKKVKAHVSGFIDESDEFTMHAMAASRIGIPVEMPSFLKTGGKSEKVSLNEIDGQKNVTVSGVVIEVKKGKTRSGGSKRTISITNGKTNKRAVIFGSCLDQFKTEHVNILDRVKLENANVFEPEYGDGQKGSSMLTCGDYSSITNLGRKRLSRLIKPFKNAKKNKLASFEGVVMETSENIYLGCGKCSKGIPKDSDKEEKFKCERCNNRDYPKEYTILHAGVTNGKQGVDAVCFPRIGITASEIAFRPVTIVGTKRDDNEITVVSIKVEKNKVKAHSEHFSKSEKKESSSSINKSAFKKTAKELLSLFDDEGMKQSQLVKALARKFKDVPEEKIEIQIESMLGEEIRKKQGLLYNKE